MKLLVFGYGLIGKERVAALRALRRKGLAIQTIAVRDPAVRAPPAGSEDLTWLTSLEQCKALSPDWVIVATPHDVAPGLVREALGWGSRLLIEKPMGRSLAEAEALAREGAGRLWVGFNYRFFAGVRALFDDLRMGRFGKLVSVHMTLGHGGSPDLAGTWKLQAESVGGGCLLDPGTHLLDLCVALAPKAIKVRSGRAWRGFWNRGFDEEAQLLLDTPDCSISLDCSLVRWRSTFRIEAHGTEGYGIVNGRGRSYGPQTYVRGVRWGWQGAKSQADSEELVLTSDCADSFTLELEAHLRRNPPRVLSPATAQDALEGMRLYDECLSVVGRAGT
jgi:predicted dehydrogenase